MDGHASHMVPILLNLAISLNIVLYILPPHSSQCTQPMDGLPNQQTSSKFCELVSLKTRQNAGLKLKTNQLIEIFGQAIAFGNSSNNVRQAWKTCGYYDVMTSAGAVTLLLSIARARLLLLRAALRRSAWHRAHSIRPSE